MMLSCRTMGITIKRRFYEGVAVPIAVHGAETWSMAVVEKKRLSLMEIK